MVTRQFSGSAEDADLRRADSLAREIFSDVAEQMGTLRFSELRSRVEGISHKMLIQNLRMLERNGLAERAVHPTVPPRVEYTLTEAGHELRATVDGLCDWTYRYFRHIESASAALRGLTVSQCGGGRATLITCGPLPVPEACSGVTQQVRVERALAAVASSRGVAAEGCQEQRVSLAGRTAERGKAAVPAEAPGTMTDFPGLPSCGALAFHTSVPRACSAI